MIDRRTRWILRLPFLGVAAVMATATAAGSWWAAYGTHREGPVGATQSAAEMLSRPGMIAYMLTGGVHISPLPYWAIAPFVFVVSGLVWTGVAALAARAVRRLRRGEVPTPAA